MAEQPSTGDIHILTADTKIHVVRPGLGSDQESAQDVRYVHDQLRSTYWMKIAFSPDGRYLASGSSRGGLMCWDTQKSIRGWGSCMGGGGRGAEEGEWKDGVRTRDGVREVSAKRLGMGLDQVGGGRREKDREVTAVDWGYDMVSRVDLSSGLACLERAASRAHVRVIAIHADQTGWCMCGRLGHAHMEAR
jgi:denticleless